MARASTYLRIADDIVSSETTGYSGGWAQTAVTIDGSQREENGKTEQAIDHKDTGARLGSGPPYDWHSRASLRNYGRVNPVGGLVRDSVLCH